VVLAVPLAALFFGALVPRWFATRRVGQSMVSTEWAGVGFALSFPLALGGMRAKFALSAGLAAAAFIAAALLAVERSPRWRDLRSALDWRICSPIILAGASLNLARRSGIAMAVTPIPSVLMESIVVGLLLVLICVCVCFSVLTEPVRCLSRAASSAWVGIAAAAIALALPSTPGWLCILGFIGWFLVACFNRPVHPRTAIFAAACLLLLLICGWRRFYPAWFDYFEAGHSLSPAQSYLAGAKPYLDIAPIHGWGSDGGFDAFLFRRFGASIRLFMWRESAGSVLALLMLIAYSVSCLGPVWGGWAALLSVVICPGLISRQVLAFAAMACLARALRGASSAWAVLAGVLAAFEIFYSLEYGIIVLVGVIVGLAMIWLLDGRFEDSSASAFRLVLLFAVGVLGGAAPFLIALTGHGAVVAFLHGSFVDMSKWADVVWGLPAGPLWSALPLGFLAQSDVHVLAIGFALALAASILLVLAATGRLDTTDRVIFVALAAGIAALRPMLGRLDGPHVARYGVFAAVPLTWSLMRSWRSGSARFALTGTLAVFVIAALHPLRALENHLAIVENSARQFRSSSPLTIARSGGALLPLYDVQNMVALRTYLDDNLRPGETFFDFANQPTLYFVADRRSPVRYMTVAQYEAPERQREVLSALEREQPPVVVLPTGMYANLDGVSNAERAPLVAQYVERHYRPDRQVGPWLIGRRTEGPPSRTVHDH